MAGALTSHLLPDHIIEKVVNTKQHPMNPHKQRLMVAEAKKVSPVETKKKKKKSEVGTGKELKSKAKAKSKAKVTPDGDDSATSRSAYSAAKRAFMEKFLNLCHPRIYCSFKRFFYI